MHIGGIVIQHAHVIAQGEQLFLGFGQFLVVRGVIGITQRFEHGADHHARVVQQAEVIAEFLAPQIVEGRDGFGHPRRIVHDHGHAHGVGHGVHVAGIKVLVEIGGIEVFPAGELFLIQREQQVFLARQGKDVVAGNDDVVFAGAVGLQFHEHFLIAGKHGIIDGNAGFRGEIGDGGFIHIAFPREDVEHFFLFAQRRG